VAIASALATEAMGLHYILGAFVTGAIMPASLRKPILDRLQGLTPALLMPFFFTLTGLHTFIDLGLPAVLEIFVIAAAVAVVGITGGTAVAAHLVGEPWPFALGLGALLQTEGLRRRSSGDFQPGIGSPTKKEHVTDGQGHPLDDAVIVPAGSPWCCPCLVARTPTNIDTALKSN
jgi:hypothetical protein